MSLKVWELEAVHSSTSQTGTRGIFDMKAQLNLYIESNIFDQLHDCNGLTLRMV